MVGLMAWAQVSSAAQICQYIQIQFDQTVAKNMSAQEKAAAESENDSEDCCGFFLRGPIEEEIHHPKAFLYKPNLKELMVISYPNINHLFAQVHIFEQIKPPCYS